MRAVGTCGDYCPDSTGVKAAVTIPNGQVSPARSVPSSHAPNHGLIRDALHYTAPPMADALPATQQMRREAVSAPAPILLVVPAASAAMPLATAPTWHLPTRVLFRFCVAYFGVYVLFTQMLGSMTLANWTPRLQLAWPMKDLVLGTAKRVFHIDRELVLFSGSGDKTYDWVQAVGDADGRGGDHADVVACRSSPSRLSGRAQVVLPVHPLRARRDDDELRHGEDRFPLQMPFPTLLRLIEPYGNFSPMGVLWYSIGASRPYEMFTGSVEVLAGLLLFIPWTALPGALVALAATSQIFTLNMTYDVPVKLFSFHLILMSLFLLAPDVKRLLSVLVLNRTTSPSTRPPLARTPWVKWTLVAAQLALGRVSVRLRPVGQHRRRGTARGGGAPKPPLYGIWIVDEMTLDGGLRPPLLTDTDRYRRLIVNNATSIVFERMDDSLVSQPAKIDHGRQ